MKCNYLKHKLNTFIYKGRDNWVLITFLVHILPNCFVLKTLYSKSKIIETKLSSDNSALSALKQTISTSQSQ